MHRFSGARPKESRAECLSSFRLCTAPGLGLGDVDRHYCSAVSRSSLRFRVRLPGPETDGGSEEARPEHEGTHISGLGRYQTYRFSLGSLDRNVRRGGGAKRAGGRLWWLISARRFKIRDVFFSCRAPHDSLKVLPQSVQYILDCVSIPNIYLFGEN